MNSPNAGILALGKVDRKQGEGVSLLEGQEKNLNSLVELVNRLSLVRTAMYGAVPQAKGESVGKAPSPNGLAGRMNENRSAMADALMAGHEILNQIERFF